MILPKNNVKYKSVRGIKVTPKRRLIRSLQLDCYKGHLPMKCSSCRLSGSCWFFGLKEV